MTTPLDLEAIEETYPVGCHACGDTVQTCDGFYYDHGACDASGKPVPEGVERRPPDHVDDLIAEVRRLREEQQGLHEDVVYVGASCDRELTIDGVALRAARFSPTRHDVERLTRERDAARAALRANLRCDECDDLATRVHADTARFGCEAHGVGEGWADTTHAAVVREALR